MGDNIRKYWDVFDVVVENGYIVGSYIFNYLDGWVIDNIFYFYNVCYSVNMVDLILFRLFYGCLKLK